MVRCWRDAIAHPIMVPALAKDAFVRVESAERAEYQNWGTNYRAGMQEAYAPFTDGEQGLEWILRRGAERGARSIRFVGSGHSWATLSAAEEVGLDQDQILPDLTVHPIPRSQTSNSRSRTDDCFRATW